MPMMRERAALANDDAMGTKTCPQCGQRLFADMEVCYGCLHAFAREGAPAVGQAFASSAPAASAAHVPEHLPASAMRSWEDRPEESMAIDEPLDLMEAPSDFGDTQTDEGGEASFMGAPDMRTQDQSTSTPCLPLLLPGSQEQQESLDMTISLPILKSPAPSFALRVQTTAIDVTVPLPGTGLSIGRAPENDVVLHSMAVSRQHLRIEPKDGNATVFDLGATNPALFHGQEVPAELVLAAGEAIDVCGTLVTLLRAEDAT